LAGLIFRHFKELDSNSDGNVSREEMISTVKTLFNAGDVDHDGRITTIEWQSAPAAPFNAQAPAEKPLEAPPATPSGNKPLIKPGLSDTTKANVYADNWFVLYLNGKLTAVDSIDFLPHNVVSVDILPEYPMTIAVMAKDNADPKTGLEYGSHIGDAGFILKFADGTVSNASWKAKSFFKGPLNRDVANPKVEHTPIPEDWFAVNFDDSKWPNATEYNQERIDPKEAFFKSDFTGARFIWTDDLDLENTVILRARIEKPGWTKRWTTQPDLDVTNAPPLGPSRAHILHSLYNPGPKPERILYIRRVHTGANHVDHSQILAILQRSDRDLVADRRDDSICRPHPQFVVHPELQPILPGHPEQDSHLPSNDLARLGRDQQQHKRHQSGSPRLR
jgi:hypothetical protein